MTVVEHLPTAHHAMRRAVSVHGVVSHRSAAAWWGRELKVQPPAPEVTVRKGSRPGGSRLGLHVTDLHRDDIHHALDGRVTSPSRTVVDCLGSLPDDEGWAIADSALRDGAFTTGGLSLRPRASVVRVLLAYAEPLRPPASWRRTPSSRCCGGSRSRPGWTSSPRCTCGTVRTRCSRTSSTSSA